jgi:hypothetical protein
MESSLESIGVVVAVIAIEQHGLVHVGTRNVEQRIKRQGQPVLHVVAEAGEMSSATVPVRIAAVGRADATTRHVVGAVWVLVRRLQAEGWRWHSRESVIVRTQEVIVAVVRRQIEVILLLLGI